MVLLNFISSKNKGTRSTLELNNEHARANVTKFTTYGGLRGGGP